VSARLRHIVLATDDLAASVAAARQGLGLAPGIVDAEAMRSFDLEHEVLVLGSAYLEILAPLGNRPELPGARFLARGGPGGYMLDIQVADLAEVLTRAAALGLTPVVRDDYRGNLISQWHPRDFGTLLEIDQIRDGRDWHWDGEFTAEQRAAERAVPIRAQLAVPDPALMADRWAAVFGGELAGDTSVRLTGVTVTFTAMGTGRPGLMSLDLLVPADASDGDLEIAGVVFRREHATEGGAS
jgi:catechol 2,3-dioxygenase-like lactoylglutathione lyase family enzyme